ncbi:MAG TPA: amidase family protein, partial [Burkholderiaceae bacterium]|nr:amidase family protein [Burkholderiaceae bacterium]
MTTALGIAAAVRDGELRATDVLARTLERIDRLDPVVNSFTAVTRERALREAEAVDAQRAAGGPLGPLAGVPFAVKNLFDVR